MMIKTRIFKHKLEKIKANVNAFQYFSTTSKFTYRNQFTKRLQFLGTSFNPRSHSGASPHRLNFYPQDLWSDPWLCKSHSQLRYTNKGKGKGEHLL